MTPHPLNTRACGDPCAGPCAGCPERIVCRCLKVTEGEIVDAIVSLGLRTVKEVKVAGYYCESVSLVDYLVRAGGARHFTVFLRDAERYGIASALKRSYSLDGPQALEAAWKRAALEGLK